ncbi:hypothetical protein [Nocardioides speluncae]|uniref:hypothetical protein n=1 Tax=Nocardioides speluncae TaxID=2670337 RepID=UPI000D697BD8|nr:hypothetical protein [Nocardioides speluncae]
MSGELRERLGDLADQAPATAPMPNLWEQGRRYGRRRTLTQVAVASCCLLLAVGVGTAWAQLREPEFPPARGDEPVYLPDRLYNPSPWLPGTDDEGPLGLLVAIIDAERRSWISSHSGLVGVSATTGDYRFLDVPGCACDSFDESPLLSPDGRYVAYPIVGDTSGEPNTVRDKPVTGLAIYDAITGETVRHSVESAHGLADIQMAWIDGHLWFNLSHWKHGGADGASGGPIRVWSWDPVADDVARLAAADNLDLELDVVGRDQIGTMSDGSSRLRILGDREDLSHPPFTIKRTTLGGFFADPTKKRIATVGGGADETMSDGKPQPILVGTVPLGKKTTTTVAMNRVPRFRTYRLVGWRDVNHVLAHNGDSPWLMSVDVQTGAAERVTRLPDVNWGTGTQIASDMLTAPIAEAKAPPAPWDPRVKLGLSVGAVAAGIWGLVTLLRWRRRGRA